MHLLAVLLILRFSLPPIAVACLAVFWGLLGGGELFRFGRGQHDLCALRLAADGSAAARLRCGAWEPLVWLEDGLILHAFAWLRFRRANGLLYCELFLRRNVDRGAWRRLQVIGRHARPLTIAPLDHGR